LGDAAGFAWDNRDEIIAGAGDAWNAVSSMGWAEAKAKAHNKDLLGDAA